MEIIQAQTQDADEVGVLFDLYRQFYQQPADLELAQDYISSRIAHEESIIYVAYEGEEAVGFVQLYPSFCSVQASKILVLYDLYVAAEHRKKGIGEALMNRATALAKESGAARLDLLTGKDNIPGQTLYEKLGYEKTNEDFFAYSLQVAS
ncbi:MAG: GNAT family N-acetyltransferase [Ardenticatenaceae bacterium]